MLGGGTGGSGTLYLVLSPSFGTSESIDESGTAGVTFTVSVGAGEEAPSTNITVNISTALTQTMDGVSYYTTAEPSDFSLSATTVTIPAGETESNTFTLSATHNDDHDPDEDDEQVIVSIATGTGYTPYIPADSAAQVAVIEHDTPPTPPTVTITPNGDATEGGDDGEFLVSRTGSTSSGLTVYYTAAPGNSNTGTWDYGLSPSGSVYIPAGESSTPIYVTAEDDDPDVDTGLEAVTATLSTDSSYTIGYPPSATVNLHDPDGSDGLDAHGVAITGIEGEGLTVDGSLVSSAEVATFMNPAAWPATATITWATGVTTSGTIAADTTVSGQEDVMGSHLYTEEGTYPVSVTIAITGGPSITVTTTATIGDADLEPIEGFAIPGAIESTTESNYPLGSFIDENPYATASDFTIYVDWGDGTAGGTGVATADGTTTDGASLWTISASHAFPEEGNYSPTVTIDDDGGKSTTEHPTVTVGDAPLAAVATSLSAVVEGTAWSGVVAMLEPPDPSNPSSDPSTDFTAIINWGDGSATTTGTVAASGAGYTISGNHTYDEETAASTPYEVAVTIADVDPESSTGPWSTTSTAVVHDAAITVTPTPIYGATEGQAPATPWTVPHFTDADLSPDPSTSYSATIDWGDGATTTGTVTSSDNVLGSHTYTEEGDYTLQITVLDDGGATDTESETVVVGDAALSGTMTALSGVEGTTITGAVVATFTDANPYATLSDYSASITGGGNVDTAGTIESLGGGEYAVLGNLLFTDETAPGSPAAVSVVIQDDGGNSTLVVSRATITDASLSATGQNFTATEGTSFTGVVAILTDAYTPPSDNSSDFRVTITWGDGASSTGVVTLSGASYTISGTHTYAEEGTFGVGITINDDGGSSTTASATASVADAALVVYGSGRALSQVEGSSIHAGALANFFDDDPNGEVLSNFDGAAKSLANFLEGAIISA